jgi:hypothetical protein
LAEKKDESLETLELKISSEVVNQAIGDVEALVNNRGQLVG